MVGRQAIGGYCWTYEWYEWLLVQVITGGVSSGSGYSLIPIFIQWNIDCILLRAESCCSGDRQGIVGRPQSKVKSELGKKRVADCLSPISR